jgi:ABC-2 type transport system permease protein
LVFWVALRKEVLEQLRSYRLLIVGVVLVLWGLTSPLLAMYAPQILKFALPEGEALLLQLIPPPTVADAVNQYLKNLNQFGILLALLMTMGTVVQEKDKGTAALMLAKPLPRGAFLAAKFVAHGLTFAVSVAVAGVACYYYTLLLFEPLDIPAWLALNGLLLVQLLVYVALTLLCSTIARSQVVAGGLAFGFLILLSGLGAIPALGRYLPGALISWAARLALGAGQAAWPALWVSCGLIGGALLAACLVFRRQEL